VARLVIVLAAVGSGIAAFANLVAMLRPASTRAEQQRA
jgi:hypothetical protein